MTALSVSSGHNCFGVSLNTKTDSAELGPVVFLTLALGGQDHHGEKEWNMAICSRAEWQQDTGVDQALVTPG